MSQGQGALNPSQNYDHLLDVVSGYDGMHDLQYAAPLAADQVWNRGAVCSLDANGNLKVGCGDLEMPLFAINGSGDFDVSTDQGNIAGGIAGTFPAIGGYEFRTTEYVTTESYFPNDFLTPATGTDIGKVTKAPADWCDVLVCGVVSAGTDTSIYDQAVLRFWGVFLPPCTTGSSSSSGQ
jgi:hypothetical protein